MAKKRSKTPSKLALGSCELRIQIPTDTHTAIRKLVTASRSVSSIIRDLTEEVFGEGKAAPKQLDVLTPHHGYTWERVSCYCSQKTRDRGVAEVQRRGLDRKGTRKPLGIAPALAWLLVEQYGPKADA
jgi:hypothetical protein